MHATGRADPPRAGDHACMNSDEGLPRLYRELSSWWPVLSAPEDYAEEASFYWRTVCSASGTPVRTVAARPSRTRACSSA